MHQVLWVLLVKQEKSKDEDSDLLPVQFRAALTRPAGQEDGFGLACQKKG